MTAMTTNEGAAEIACSCGKVAASLAGPPILSVVCYCDDCQAGGRRVEALPNAPAVLDADGGTGYDLHRKDRVAYLRGSDLLVRQKLRDSSPTNRVIASCCNTAMLMDFDGGPHWVSVYRKRRGDEAPGLDMRINTKFRPAGPELPKDARAYEGVPFKFIWKLISARIAMLVGR